MIWLLIVTAIANSQAPYQGKNFPLMKFETTKPANNFLGYTNTEYKYLIIYDSKGKEHKFDMKAVQDAAYAELKRLGIKEE